MEVPPSTAWKLVLALTLVLAILLSQFSRAPTRAVPRGELRRLVMAALALYLVGGRSEMVMRLPSLAASLAAVALMIPLARRVAGPRGWTWAVALAISIGLWPAVLAALILGLAPATLVWRVRSPWQASRPSVAAGSAIEAPGASRGR